MAKIYLIREYYDYYDHGTGMDETGDRISEDHPAFMNKDAAQKLVDELNEKEVVFSHQVHVKDVRRHNRELSKARLALKAAEETGNKELIRRTSFRDSGNWKPLDLETYRETKYRRRRSFEVAEWDIA